MTLTTAKARELNALRVNPGRRKDRSEILEMQQLLLTDIRNKRTKPHIRALCVRAYDVLAERLRILSGKPLPGMLRPDAPIKERKRKGPSLLPMPEVPSASGPSSPSLPKEGESTSISSNCFEISPKESLSQ